MRLVPPVSGTVSDSSSGSRLATGRREATEYELTPVPGAKGKRQAASRHWIGKGGPTAASPVSPHGETAQTLSAYPREGRLAAMVLQELGSKLTSALRRLHTDTVVDKETIKAVVGDICRALLESDVNVQMVMKLRKNVEAKAEGLVADQQEGGRAAAAGGAQQRRSIQKAVVDELTGMLDPKTAPYKMKKGKSNVVMFVGLQVRER